MTYLFEKKLCGESPFYTDFLYKFLEKDENFGIKNCDWDNTGAYLKNRKNDICNFFNEYYYLREIGSETPTRWLLLLNRRFNQIKDEYNFKFEMYSKYDFTELGKKITTTSDSEHQDTPVTNLTGDYATNKDHNTTIMELDTDQKIDEISRAFNQYHNLVREFVEEFERCFINVVGRI